MRAVCRPVCCRAQRRKGVGESDSTVCLTIRCLSFRLDFLLIYIPCWLFLFLIRLQRRPSHYTQDIPGIYVNVLGHP